MQSFRRLLVLATFGSSLYQQAVRGPAAANSTGTVRVTALGALSDGTNAAATTAAFRSAFVAGSSSQIVVPPGTYLINNSTGPLIAADFNGELRFESGAKLAFTSSEKSGLLFLRGTGARIEGLRADYVREPSFRHSPQEQLKFSDTTDTLLTDTVVKHSPAAGILFFNCMRPKVINAQVIGSLADGLHFANCQDADVDRLTTENTGDDGLAFLNYAAYPNKTGGRARNILIRNSMARGIAVVGQSRVVISGFTIENTASSGILCDQDKTFRTRIPADVRFENGRILGAGTLARSPGSLYGIEFNSQANCDFLNITVVGSQGAGVSGTAPAGSATLRNIRVEQPHSGGGFNFYRTALVDISSSTASDIPSYGFVFNRCARVIAHDLFAISTSMRDPLRRAIWFENGQFLKATHLIVSETTQPEAKRVVGAYQSPEIVQRGSIENIVADPAGSVVIENNCPGVTIAQPKAIADSLRN
ncbi:MAG: right-handed parallel beta-helix repeat-containing protein [Bryobacteraceae bacterium]